MTAAMGLFLQRLKGGIVMTIYSQHPNRGRVQILATYRGLAGVTSSTVTSVESDTLAAPIVGALNRISACATVPVSVHDRRDDDFRHYPRTHLEALTDRGARADLLKGTYGLWYEYVMTLLHAALNELDDAMANVPAPVRTAIAAELKAEASWLRAALAEFSEGTPSPASNDQRCWDFGAPFVAFGGGMEPLSDESRDHLNRQEDGGTAEERVRGVDDLRLLVEAHRRCDNHDATLDFTELTIFCDPDGLDRYYLTVDAPLPGGLSRRTDWRVEIGQWDVGIDDPESDVSSVTGESVLYCARATSPLASELTELLNLSGERPGLLAEWAKTPTGEALVDTAFIVTKRSDRDDINTGHPTHGLNVIDVNGAALLLTTTSGGVAVHLTAATDEPGAGREAVHHFYFDSDRHDPAAAIARYDRAALAEPRWSRTTLCGRDWAITVGGDGGAIGTYGEVAHAPTCRRCLALIDRHFPKPERDARLALVAQLAADAVVGQRGFAEIHDVPGDQQDELRKTIRALIRQRTSNSVRTYSLNGVVYIECQAIYDQLADLGKQAAAEAIDAVLTGEPLPQLERDWVISWATWDVS